MSSRFLLLLFLGFVAAPTFGDEDKKQEPKPLAEQFAAFKQAHQQRDKQFMDELRAVGRDDAKVDQANVNYHKFVQEQAQQLTNLIKKNRDQPDVVDGVLVLVGELRFPLDDELVQLVLDRHVTNAKMGELCFHLRYRRTEEWAEKIIRETVAKTPDHAVRGQATYALADYNRERALPYGEKVSEENKTRWLQEAATHFTSVVKQYADVLTPDCGDKLGDLASRELTRIKNLQFLQVGKEAPEISGEDIDGKPFKLSDNRGKVVVLDFWGHW